MYLQEETTLNGVESSISSGPQLKERYRCFSVFNKKNSVLFSNTKIRKSKFCMNAQPKSVNFQKFLLDKL